MATVRFGEADLGRRFCANQGCTYQRSLAGTTTVRD